MAEALGVSRPAVREALQRLAQSRLVDIRQGEGTLVTDYRRTAGPELLPHLLVDATDNVALRLLFNALRSAHEPALPALAVVLAALDAIADG